MAKLNFSDLKSKRPAETALSTSEQALERTVVLVKQVYFIGSTNTRWKKSKYTDGMRLYIAYNLLPFVHITGHNKAKISTDLTTN